MSLWLQNVLSLESNLYAIMSGLEIRRQKLSFVVKFLRRPHSCKTSNFKSFVGPERLRNEQILKKDTNFHVNKWKTIEDFHCHTIIKTIQPIKSRIKDVKEDEHSNSLAKIQVCAIFRTGDIRRNVFLKFLRLCMETPCLCPSEGHKYGGRKLTKTDLIEFAIKSL